MKPKTHPVVSKNLYWLLNARHYPSHKTFRALSLFGGCTICSSQLLTQYFIWNLLEHSNKAIQLSWELNLLRADSVQHLQERDLSNQREIADSAELKPLGCNSLCRDHKHSDRYAMMCHWESGQPAQKHYNSVLSQCGWVKLFWNQQVPPWIHHGEIVDPPWTHWNHHHHGHTAGPPWTHRGSPWTHHGSTMDKPRIHHGHTAVPTCTYRGSTMDIP